MQLFFLEPKAQILTTKKVNVYKRFSFTIAGFCKLYYHHASRQCRMRVSRAQMKTHLRHAQKKRKKKKKKSEFGHAI